VEIKTTGNDFHKGGKQVLILTFSLVDAHGDRGRGRVVYKPSAVEIDCRIVGDSAVVNGIRPKGTLPGSVEYTQPASLTEIINQRNPPRRRGGFTSRPLPTYVVLPYDGHDVAEAYGYIQFLSHEPAIEAEGLVPEQVEAAVGRAVLAAQQQRDVVTGSDWIVRDPKDGQVFCYQLGALMAMALSVSLCDLHVQNGIVHARLPHLIDLEEALKQPMTKVTETLLSRLALECADPKGKELKIFQEGTSELAAGWVDPSMAPATCTLYEYRAAGPAIVRVGLAGPEGQANREALVRGLTDVVDVLASADGNRAVKDWVRGLDRTLARFVPWGTANYLFRARMLYQDYCENSIDSLAQPGGYKAFQNRGDRFYVNNVHDRYADWRARAGAMDPGGRPEWVTPFFAVEHPDHAWKDYLNGDVPSFYHVLGSDDLLNARGGVVDVGAAMRWQDDAANIDPPDPATVNPADPLSVNARRPLPGRGPAAAGTLVHYFPERPIDMIEAQLDRLLAACATRQGKLAYLRRAVSDIAVLQGSILDFRDRMLAAMNVH
jgi:hypothetical protein